MKIILCTVKKLTGVIDSNRQAGRSCLHQMPRLFIWAARVQKRLLQRWLYNCVVVSCCLYTSIGLGGSMLWRVCWYGYFVRFEFLSGLCVLFSADRIESTTGGVWKSMLLQYGELSLEAAKPFVYIIKATNVREQDKICHSYTGF